MKTHEWDVGEVIHGLAGGAFGRDSYDCRRVEAIGHDWVVTRNGRGQIECVSGDQIPAHHLGLRGTTCDYHMCDW